MDWPPPNTIIAIVTQYQGRLRHRQAWSDLSVRDRVHSSRDRFKFGSIECEILWILWDTIADPASRKGGGSLLKYILGCFKGREKHRRHGLTYICIFLISRCDVLSPQKQKNWEYGRHIACGVTSRIQVSGIQKAKNRLDVPYDVKWHPK